ncbi:MAG: AEC family transporter [Mogibacterium sp.]|nr:AEC family transporter [Mogibacterium sp.]
MNYFAILLPNLIKFLIFISVGYGVSRFGVIRREGLPTIASMLINVLLPLLVVSIMAQHGTTFMDLLSYRKMIAGQLFGYFVLTVSGILVSNMLGLTGTTRNVHQGCMVGGNYAYIVIPLILAMFPVDDGQQYIPICSAVDTITVWTLTISLFTRGIDTGEKSRLAMIGRKLLHPVMVAILTMLTLNSLSVEVPAPIMDACSELGGICASLSLVYVGAMIFFMQIGSIQLIRNASVMALTKLLIAPMIIYAVVSRFLPETESIILMLVAGCPTYTIGCAITEQYKLDTDYAATIIFVTTVGCLVTIPLLFMFVSLIG